MKKISVCIPTYEMRDLGHIFLKESFDILISQTFKDFDIVISDHSQNDKVESLCHEYNKYLDIKYYKNNEKVGSSSANINNALKKATGEIIKILFQDDFLYNQNSLKEIYENFDLNKDYWMATACEHTKDGLNLIRPFYPKYNNKIHLGKNTLGSPSVLVLKNENLVFFDENLVWLMDCDYYKKCYNSFGEPKILNKITVVNRIGKHQVTSSIANQHLRFSEYKYILKRYEKGINYIYLIFLGYIKYIIRKTIKI